MEPRSDNNKQRIAIIGSGISGLTCGYLLSRNHHVTVFEAGDYIGGHTATKSVSVDSGDYWIDTGFIVFNDRTYPNFIRLLDQLQVSFRDSEMGFSVSNQGTGVEYSGSGFNGVFAQRKRLFDINYWRFLTDIMRFNREVTKDFEGNAIDTDCTLGTYLQQNGYNPFFQEHYILPMVSAIWSSGVGGARAMPMHFFAQFFHNHGLLTVTQQPQWYTVTGGSHRYIEPLIESFKDSIRVSTPVTSVSRGESIVRVRSEAFGEEEFDQVIFACHSDQALSLLSDPSESESAILGNIAYEENDVVLHTDESLLPTQQRAWASWNYQLGAGGTLDSMVAESSSQNEAVLTYNMNILQGIQAPETFCVTLNATDQIDADKILGRYRYSHPQFTLDSVAAQQRWSEVSGQQRTHYCGAYWRNGFHEDGVVSALRVSAAFGELL